MSEQQQRMLRFVLRRIALHADTAMDMDLARLEELACVMMAVVHDAQGYRPALEKDPGT